MSGSTSPIVAGAVGLVVGAGIVWSVQSSESPTPAGSSPPGTAGQAGPKHSPPRVTTADDVRLARIEEEITALTRAVDRIGERLDARPADATRTPVVDATARPVVDAETLVEALERVEQLKLEGMSDDELLDEARRLQHSGDKAASRRAFELLLSRDLERIPRAKAATELGILHRNSGDLEASAATLEQAVQDADVHTLEGAWAAYQLVWTRRYQGNARQALEMAEAVIRSGDANESLRIHGRWCAATLSHDLGDIQRARADYAQLITDCGDDPSYSNIVQDVQRRLDQIR